MTTEASREVKLERHGPLGLVTLERPKALNALTHGMVVAMAGALRDWALDPAVATVVLAGAGERAFCAGGDIRAICDAVRVDSPMPAAFWRDEYRLNALIARYPKPIVALMNGLVMGGGLGLSGHASHRVVTDTTLVAMPEVGIGFLPDVGGTYLLSRSPGELGTHAALTAARLGPADAIRCGLADFHVPASGRAAIPAALADCRGPNQVSDALRALASPAARGALAAAAPWIDTCYVGDSVEAIVERLRHRPEDAARAAAASIASHAPTSLKVTLRALRSAASLDSLEACLEQEYRLALALVRRPDFLEGVRAAVVDKDRAPRWAPARLEEVASEDVDHLFTSETAEPVFAEAGAGTA